MLDPQVEARSWDEQLALDDVAYRAQLAYLLERSPFYRDKLERSSADDAGGLAEIARLPLTEKPELKATATEENPVGAHLCVDRSEIVRIYSTSGTTGNSELHPADHAGPGRLGHRLRSQLRGVRDLGRPAHRVDVQRRPVRGWRGARLVRPDRPLPCPRRHGEHGAARARDRAAAT